MSIETIHSNPDHFESHHENGETILCMQHNSQCSILVEVQGTPEQQEILRGASERTLKRLDDYFGGRMAELFSGLHIKFGDYDGGGEAHQEKNLITFDTNRMSMSLADAEALLVGTDVLNPGDWTGTMTSEAAEKPGSCLDYNLPHEIYHMLDIRSETGEWEGIDVSLSPTKYGSQKRNEAAAETFAYMIYGREVNPAAFAVFERRVSERMSEIE
jgi:hypothetical protein